MLLTDVHLNDWWMVKIFFYEIPLNWNTELMKMFSSLHFSASNEIETAVKLPLKKRFNELKKTTRLNNIWFVKHFMCISNVKRLFLMRPWSMLRSIKIKYQLWVISASVVGTLISSLLSIYIRAQTNGKSISLVEQSNFR